MKIEKEKYNRMEIINSKKMKRIWITLNLKLNKKLKMKFFKRMKNYMNISKKLKNLKN